MCLSQGNVRFDSDADTLTVRLECNASDISAVLDELVAIASYYAGRMSR